MLLTSDLFDVVGYTYEVSDIHFDGTDTLTLTGGVRSTRGIAANDQLVIKKSDNSTVVVDVDM